MKRNLVPVLLLAAVLLPALARSQDEPLPNAEWIGKVKEAVLQSDKGIRIGNAFDDYKFFTAAPKWSGTQMRNARRIVEVTGTIDFRKLKAEDIGDSVGNVDLRKSGLGSVESGVGQNDGTAKASPAENQARLQKINQKYRSMQLVFELQLNVDDTVDAKGVTVHLTTVDGKVIQPRLAWGANTSILADIYNEKVPAEPLLAILKGEELPAPTPSKGQ
jgi:hypothetical protein